MKWFKHYSSASMDDKIERIEAKFGLVGYAAYFKILEACALNWDEISDPVFTFSLKQIQNKLRMKSKQTDLVLGLFQELNLFQISKTKNEVTIRFDKLAEIKKKYQKRDQVATRQSQNNVTPNKNKEEDIRIKNKEEEKRSATTLQKIEEAGEIPKDILETIKINYQYSNEVIEEVRKDAWLKYIAIDDPQKNWRRFVANYFKHEKDKIRNMLIAKSKEAEVSNGLDVNELVTRVINSSHLQASEFQKLFTASELELIRRFGSRKIASANEFELKQIKKEMIANYNPGTIKNNSRNEFVQNVGVV